MPAFLEDGHNLLILLHEICGSACLDVVGGETCVAVGARELVVHFGCELCAQGGLEAGAADLGFVAAFAGETFVGEGVVEMRLKADYAGCERRGAKSNCAGASECCNGVVAFIG